MGRAGPGAFFPYHDVPGALAAYYWSFTRITDYKKDTAKLANGNVVLQNSTTTSDTPKMSTLAECEEELGTTSLGAVACLKLYAHATTKASKATRVVPSDKPRIFWCPSQAEPAKDAPFSSDSMGQWLRSREDPQETPASGGNQGVRSVECHGLLRPCFEVSFCSMEKSLKPPASKNANPMCLFLINPLHLQSKHVCSL